MPAVTARDIQECVGFWRNYLQTLNGLCAAGARLARSLQTLLAEGTPQASLAAGCHAMWEDLVRTTATASATVRAEAVAALQDLADKHRADADISKLPAASEVASTSLTMFVNVQYQFCSACCECLKNITRFAGAKEVLSGRQSRSNVRMPPTVFLESEALGSGRRRWSAETAGELSSGEASVANDPSQRRWSAPEDVAPLARANFPPQSRQVTLHPHSGDTHSSRSNTPEQLPPGLVSTEELGEVIQLLSCRPADHTALCHPSRHLPGVTLTSYSDGSQVPRSGTGPLPVWDWGPHHTQHGNSRPSVLGLDVHNNSHRCCRGAVSTSRRLSSPRAPPSSEHGLHSLSHRSSWPAHDLHAQVWSDPECHGPAGITETDTGHSPFDLFRLSMASRKSSSSTDSSSSHSHSRSSGSEGSSEVRSHLYSMWEGSDVTPALPFIRLPESPDDPGGSGTTSGRTSREGGTSEGSSYTLFGSNP